MAFFDSLTKLEFPSEENIKRTLSLPILQNLHLNDINCNDITFPSSTIFPSDCAIEFKYWLKQVQDRLDNVRLTYIFLMYYFDKKNSDMFYYYVNFIYYQIFSIFDNIYYLLNIYYQMDLDPRSFIEEKVIEQLKINNKDLYNYLIELYKNGDYKKGSDIRNSFVHGYLPTNIKSGLVFENGYCITDETIKKFEEENIILIVNEKSLEKLDKFLSDDEKIMIKCIKNTPQPRKCMQKFLKKLKFSEENIKLIIEHSETKKTTTIIRKIKRLERMKSDCMKESMITDKQGLTSFNKNFFTKNDYHFKYFTKKEKEEIIRNSKRKIRSVSYGGIDYTKPKEFKDNIEQLITLLSETLIEFKIKLNLVKSCYPLDTLTGGTAIAGFRL